MQNHQQFPVLIEQGEDGHFVVECPILHGCATQGNTIEEALVNIKEAIQLCLEEEKDSFIPQNVGLHFVTV